MTPHDQQRFADLVSNFVRDSDIAPPLHVVLIGSNGSVSVRHHTDGKAETVCSKVVASGFTGPIVVAVIGQDGCGKSARITIEAVGPILQ